MTHWGCVWRTHDLVGVERCLKCPPSFLEPVLLIFCFSNEVGVLVLFLVLVKWCLSASLVGRPGWLLGLHWFPEFEM